MKKTITRPDGTQEVVEGTPEELAELERIQAERPVLTKESTKGGRRLLKDSVHPYDAGSVPGWRQKCVG
jgi:hypothetical protein